MPKLVIIFEFFSFLSEKLFFFKHYLIIFYKKLTKKYAYQKYYY